MPASKFAIGAFRGVPGIAEIVALGRVRRQPESALEPQIEVLLASDLDDPGFDPNRDVYVRQVACGQLDLMTVGSRWKGRSPAGETRAKRYSASFFLGEEYALLGVGADQPVTRRRPVPTRLMAEAPCFLLERENPDIGSSDPRKVLLPHMELVRALFGVSGRILIELIDGLRDPTVAERGILDRRSSRRLPDGAVRLVCWKKPTDEEALILAAMVADPMLMRLHDEVFQRLVVQKGYREGKPTWPKVTWPFSMPIALTVEGRWFERNDGFVRFLSTRITEIGLRLNFNRIEVHHPGAGEDKGSDRLPPPTGRMRLSNARLVVLTTGRAPSPSRRPVEIASFAVAIPESKGVPIDFIAKGGPSPPRTSTLGEVSREEGEFSTAGRETGAHPAIGRADVRRMVGGDSSAAASDREQALRCTWVALCKASSLSGWRITPYPVAGAGEMSARDGGFDFRREGILAGLNVGGRHVIVADERTAPQDYRSLGVLVKKMERAVTWLDVQAIRAAHDSVRGHWGAGDLFVDGFEIVPVRRRAGIMADADAYAKLLRDRVADVFGKVQG